jgi:hypothetical protein
MAIATLEGSASVPGSGGSTGKGLGHASEMRDVMRCQVAGGLQGRSERCTGLTSGPSAQPLGARETAFTGKIFHPRSENTLSGAGLIACCLHAAPRFLGLAGAAILVSCHGDGSEAPGVLR